MLGFDLGRFVAAVEKGGAQKACIHLLKDLAVVTYNTAVQNRRENVNGKRQETPESTPPHPEPGQP